jgi:hypothetical protein
MLVVAPKGSKVGYFKRNGILCTAEISEHKLDLTTTQAFDFFDDNSDWQEAMTALELLEKREHETE